jgi:hypothetical protein
LSPISASRSASLQFLTRAEKLLVANARPRPGIRGEAGRPAVAERCQCREKPFAIRSDE